MKKLCQYFILSFLMTSSSANAEDKWSPWFEAGGSLSSEDSSGSGTVFIPLWQSPSDLIFSELRANTFENNQFEYNFALGFRNMNDDGRNLGAWIGFDHLHTANDSNFGRISLGLETLHLDWGLRINGYLPTNKRNHLGTTKTSISHGDPYLELRNNNSLLIVTPGSTNITTQFDEFNFHGIDIEAGIRLPLEDYGAGNASIVESDQELWLYAGGYWFDQNGWQKAAIMGPQVRIEYRLNNIIKQVDGSRLSIEGNYQYDKIFNHQAGIGIQLRIPFGHSQKTNTVSRRLSRQEQRMQERLEHKPVIAAKQAEVIDTVVIPESTELTQDALTNVNFDRVAIASSGDDLQAAVNTAGANSLIIARDGTFAQTALQDNQTLQGGGATIAVRGRDTGIVLQFTAPGTLPTIQHAGGSAVLSIANNTHVEGVNIQGASLANNHGVAAPAGAFTNVFILDNNISQIDSGISFEASNNSSQVTISKNVISDVLGDGVEFENGNSMITISDNSLSNIGGKAIEFDFNNTLISITNNTLNNVGENAIEFDDDNSQLTITSNNINGSDTGIIAFDNNSVVNITNNSFANIIDDAIRFDDFNSMLTISNNTFTNIGNDGFDFDDNNTTVTIMNNTLDNVNDDGFVASDNNSLFSLTNNTFTNVANDAIEFDDNSSMVSIINNTLINIVEDGISLDNTNSDLTITNNTIDNADRALVLGNSNSNVTINNNTITNVIADGFLLDGGNTSIVFSNNTIIDVGEDAFDIGDAAANSLSITNNIYSGNVGGDLIEFDGQIETLIDGSGNTISPSAIFGNQCELVGAAGFVGVLELGASIFVNGAGCL